MLSTVAFVTDQYSSERIISAARQIADKYETNLDVVGVMANEYEIDPEAIDYLFNRSKEHKAAMRLIFREDKTEVMREIIGQYDCKYIVSGMPSSNKSVLYDVWKEFDNKGFFTVDKNGNIIEVANKTELSRAR